MRALQKFTEPASDKEDDWDAGVEVMIIRHLRRGSYRFLSGRALFSRARGTPEGEGYCRGDSKHSHGKRTAPSGLN